MNTFKRHLTVANVLSLTALFVALSASAYAAVKLQPGQVKAVNLAKQAVTNPKIKTQAVTSGKIKNSGVLAGDLAAGSVINSKIANEAVGTSKLGKNSVTTAKIGPEAVTAGKIGNESITASKLSASFYAQLVRNVSYASKTSSSGGNFQTVTAECPAGKQVVGGGAKANPGGAETAGLTESYPSLGGEGKRTGWTATVTREGADGGVISVEAYAICAEL